MAEARTETVESKKNKQFDSGNLNSRLEIDVRVHR